MESKSDPTDSLVPSPRCERDAVGGAAGGGDAILEELKKLTQLHKLGVSGINRSNILKFYSVISGLAHLESLSLRVQVDEDDDEAGWLDDDISFEPLVNLLSLKLYGLGRKLPKCSKQLKNLRKLSLQMTMLPQEGIDDLADSLPELDHLRIFFVRVPRR